MWDAAIKSAERNHFANLEMEPILFAEVTEISSRLALKWDATVGRVVAVIAD
jgi:hypothetical protein